MRSKVYKRLVQCGRWLGKGQAGRVLLLSLLLTALTAVGWVVSLRDSLAQSGGTAPDYSTVDDFTGGRPHLLRNDDLVLTYDYVGGGGEITERSILFSAGTTNSTPTFTNYKQPIIPNGQVACTTSGGCSYDFMRYNASTKAVAGRFFNTVKDTVVQYPMTPTVNPYNPLYLVAMTGTTNNGTPPAAGLTVTSAQEITSIVITEYDNLANNYYAEVADFNQDGFDDLAMFYGSGNTGAAMRARIATAVDTNDPSKGFAFGPELVASHGLINALTAGDYNNDKQPDLASVVGTSPRLGSIVYMYTYQVDPKTLTISIAASQQFTGVLGVPTDNTLVSGRFSLSGGEQIAYGWLDATDNNYVNIIGFAPNSLQPISVSSWYFNGPYGEGYFSLKAGRFNWNSPFDQLAVMTSTFDAGTTLQVLTVDPATLAITPKANYKFDKESLAFAGNNISLGNFDHQEPTAGDPTKRERDPDLQIALTGLRRNADGSVTTAGVAILDVSDDFLTITATSYSVLDTSYFNGAGPTDMNVLAADLQGRSFRLGAGYKVTVDQTMPSVVLAVPPMHADYVSPGIGQPPTVLNLSVVPDAFNTVYEEDGSSSSSASYTHTTSSSFAGEESLNQKIALGSFDVVTGALSSGVAIEDTFTAKQDISTSNDTINGSFNSSDIDISQNTGISDVVWFKDSSYYLYVYPVIGRKVCPADKADNNGNCADSDKVPMQLMFSAPKQTTITRMSTDTLEWYQPPWEPGNLFSYPAGLAQLKQYIPDINLLTADTTTFGTDDASATLKTTWSNGRNTGTNVTQENLFTEDNDLSVEGVYSVKFFGQGGSGSTKLDLNFGGSDGTKGLTQASVQFNSARGITVNKKASFAAPLSYQYFFSPYIFGKVQPVNYTDPVPSDPNGLLSYGALRTAFTADTLGTGTTQPGNWWSQSPYKQFPDIAINHPNRWSYGQQAKPANGNIPANCVGVDNLSMDCISQNGRTPENPWLDAFHDMRGFFITDAANPPNANPFIAGGGGAQLESATAGDKLTLSTRVYNYSFTAMPAGSRVKVRFYRMNWNPATNFPADAVLTFNDDGSTSITNPGGASVQIGNDVVLAPVAPFNNDPKAPLNWSVASTTFDTTGLDNSALVFWVAVWMEDANGNLLREVANHGLTAIPDGTATPVFGNIASLEQMVANPLKQSASDPATVSFSNNVGFYKTVFHILSATAPTSVARRSAAGAVQVESVNIFGSPVKLGQPATAKVLLRGGDQELRGLTVYFYNGDPAAGGRLVDAERIARLRAGEQQASSILFRTRECGSHQLFVRVTQAGDVIATGKSAQLLRVECSQPVCTTQLCMRSAQYYSLNLGRLPKGVVTVAGRGAQSQVSTSETPIMRILLQGGNGAQQKFNQQFVATQLNLISQPGANPSALSSNLVCYGLNFQPVELKSKAILNPGMTLGQLFDQARIAASTNNLIDMRQISAVLQLLNGDDPSGRCRR